MSHKIMTFEDRAGMCLPTLAFPMLKDIWRRPTSPMRFGSPSVSVG